MCSTITEDDKLRQDLEKVEQLESKVTKELSELQIKIDQMTKDLVTYSDTDTQRKEAEDLKQVLCLGFNSRPIWVNAFYCELSGY